jgi:phage-related protein (TIGR01555 family)
LDRWQIAPVINEDALYDYSKATHYQIISGDLIRQPQLVKIHKDRILRFDGEWLPYRIRQRNYGWGMSTLQSVYDSFRFYSTGISSAATLLTEFDIFVHKLRGLSSMLAAGKEKDVRDRLVLNDMSKSIYRGYAIDAEKEELEFISRNFGGVGEILEKLRIDIIGASQIPHTILFGESPGGLGSTGRSEERDFTKHLGDYQASHYKRPLQHLMKMIMMSKEGPTSGKVPESWRIKFNDLFELNEREKADVRARVAAVDGRYIQLGVLHPQEVADARYGGSEWSMELTLDPSLPRELPQAPGQKAVPPGGREPLEMKRTARCPWTAPGKWKTVLACICLAFLRSTNAVKKRKTQNSKIKRCISKLLPPPRVSSKCGPVPLLAPMSRKSTSSCTRASMVQWKVPSRGRRPPPSISRKKMPLSP